MLSSVEQNLSYTPLRCWSLLSAPTSTRTYPNQGAFTHCCAPSVSISRKCRKTAMRTGMSYVCIMHQPPFRPVPPTDPWSPCPRQNAAVFSPFSFTRKYAPRGQSILPLAPPHKDMPRTDNTHTRCRGPRTVVFQEKSCHRGRLTTPKRDDFREGCAINLTQLRQ